MSRQKPKILANFFASLALSSFPSPEIIAKVLAREREIGRERVCVKERERDRTRESVCERERERKFELAMSLAATF